MNLRGKSSRVRPSAAALLFFVGALAASGGCADGAERGLGGADPAAALRARYPEHAARVLTAARDFSVTEQGFHGAVAHPDGEVAGARWNRDLDADLPNAAERAMHLHAPGGLDVDVREASAHGPVERVAEGALTYERDGGRSFWTTTANGYEEWLMLEPGIATSDRVAASWELAGATAQQDGDAIEVLDEAGAARLRVEAPEAHTASGRAVTTRLEASGTTIRVYVDANGEGVLVDPSWSSTGTVTYTVQPSSSWTQGTGLAPFATSPGSPPNPHESTLADVNECFANGVLLQTSSNTCAYCGCVSRDRSFALPSPVSTSRAHLKSACFDATRGFSDQYGVASLRVALYSGGTMVGTKMIATEHRANNNCGSDAPEIIVQAAAGFDIPLSSIATNVTFDTVRLFLEGYGCCTATETIELSDITVTGGPQQCPSCTPIDQCHDAGTCDTSTGMCTTPPKQNGTGCNDGNACTQGDTCQSGVCIGGAAVVCGQPDACHVGGVCNPQTGTCSNPAKPDGTSCSGGDLCAAEVCESGVCTGGPVVCPMGDECHDTGTCDPSSGVCSNPPKPDGSPCAGGTCMGGKCAHVMSTSSSGVGGAGGSGAGGSGAGGSGAGGDTAATTSTSGASGGASGVSSTSASATTGSAAGGGAPSGSGATGSGGTSSGSHSGSTGTQSGASTGAAGGGGGSAAAGGKGAADDTGDVGTDSGCGCEVPAAPTGGAPWFLIGLVFAALRQRAQR